MRLIGVAFQLNCQTTWPNNLKLCCSDPLKMAGRSDSGQTFEDLEQHRPKVTDC